MVGLDAGNVLFDTAEETGGSADATLPTHTHTATVTDPSHSHASTAGSGFLTNGGNEIMAGGFDVPFQRTGNTAVASTGISVTNASAGTSGTNANYQPFITVYMWKRTA